MYPNHPKKKAIVTACTTAICLSSVVYAHAATLGQRAIYDMQILPNGHANQVGQCSAFTFGDVSDSTAGTYCTDNTGGGQGLTDNADLPQMPLSGGAGVLGDGFTGVVQIETGVADINGVNTYSVLNFQMDPYLKTAGGTFKTTIHADYPDPLGGTPGGTISATGGMTLDVSGRHGVAASYYTAIGVQPWNIDNSVNPNVQATGQYQSFTTGSSSSWDSSIAGSPAGVVAFTLNGRSIGDANADTILDAILVSAGNIGIAWGGFDSTIYSEAYNVQFVLVSAKPTAMNDTLVGSPSNPLVIDVAADLLANDVHADPAETISLSSFTQPTGTNSTLVDNGNGTLTFTPPDLGVATDTFTYTIVDSTGVANGHTATVTVNLASGQPPVANNDSLNADEDVATSIDPTLNDTDPNTTDVLTILSFDTASGQGGTITAGTGNELIYTSAQNFSGSDNFNYTITDGNGNIASATVNVTVASVNDPLVCTGVELFTDIDVPLDILLDAVLLSTCSDIDGPSAPAYQSVQSPADQGGIVVFDSVNTITYTPAPGFNGQDTFTYTVTDGVDTDVRTVTVTVGANYGNFTMLNDFGDTFGGTNDVEFNWDGTFNTDEVNYNNNKNFNLTMASAGPTKFSGFIWYAHTARVFGPGVYEFDTGCTVAEIQATGCPANSAANSGPTITMTVDPGQVGLHVLFDWSTSKNIDVVNVYNQNQPWDDLGEIAPRNALFLGLGGPSPNPTTDWEWVSTDDDGDGFVGVPMIDGPFLGYSANFNKGPGGRSGLSAPIFDGTAANTSLGTDGSLFGGGALGIGTLFVNVFVLIALRRSVRNRNK